ncbi:MAG: hypothetical protein M0Z53_15845 [Thermaerobacter sp.]|nr:hypothetical protein [Thermaerobacter sp.]
MGKHRGYHYEHLFSKKWTAIKNWHTAMRFAHLLNVLILSRVALWATFIRLGLPGSIRWLHDCGAGRWLDPAHLAHLRHSRPQLRLMG